MMSMISGLNNRSIMSNKPREVYGHSQDFDDGVRKTNNNFRTSNRGFSYNKSSNRPFKDPDVWDPPPQVQKNKEPIKRISKNISNNQPYPAKGRKGAQKGLDANGKKTFLSERYPDGNGPDTNLIEML